MATRVNTKFVAGLAAVMVLVPLAVLVFWMFWVQVDPAQLKARGDVHMQQGEVRAAVDKYKDAVNERRNDVDLIMTAVRAMERMPVRDIVEARETHQQVHGWTRQAVDLAPQNDKLLREFYHMLLSEARRLGSPPGAYQQLYNHADSRLQSDPGNLIAHKFRGIGQVHDLNATTAEATWQQGKQDLTRYLEKHPKDAEALYHLAMWHLARAQQQDRPGGDREQAEQHRERALTLSRRMLEADPDSVDRLMKRVRVLLHPQIAHRDQARPLVDRLETLVRKKPEPPRRVLSLVAFMQRLTPEQAAADADSALTRARQLLESAIEAHPQFVSYHLSLGQVLREQGKVDQAVEAFSKARSINSENQQRTARQVLRARGMQQAATQRLAETLLRKASKASGQQQEAVFTRVEGLIETLQQQAGGATGSINRLRGELALQRGKPADAAERLDRAIEQLPGDNPRLVSLAAEAYLQQDAWGAAAERLEELSADYEQAASLHLRLAQIYLQKQQLDKAQQHIEAVLAQNPDHIGARQLKGQLFVRRKQYEQAISVYESFDLNKRPGLIPTLAQLYNAADQPKKARQLLQQRLAQAPADIRALRVMLGLTDDPAKQRQWVARAAEAGANKQVISLLQTAIASRNQSPEQRRKTQQQFMERLVSQQKDPAQKALLRARIQLRRGNTKQAESIIQQAAEQAPDNPSLVRLQFDLALAQNEFERAAELADRAGAMNLDNARGRFIHGRLHLAQGHLDQAVAALKRGVSAKPVDSHGRRLLGDALRRQGKVDQAAQAYEKAVAQKPDNVEARQNLAGIELQRGNPDAALKQLRAARRYRPNDPTLRERYLRVEGQYGDAERAFELRRQMAENKPQNLANRRQLVLLLSQLDRHRAALDAARGLIEDDGRNRQNMAVLARAHRAAGHPGQGAQVLEDYIDQRGQQATARDYMLLAQYQLLRGRGQAALAAYEQAMQREDPSTSLASRQLAQLFFQRGLNERAAELYRKLYQRNPEKAESGYRWAEALVRMGEIEQAEQLLSDLPSGATAQAMRGMIALHRGQSEQARELFTESLRANPDQPVVLFQRGRLRANSGQLNQAANDLTRALEKNPNLHPARMRLARLRWQQGDTELAIQTLRDLLSRNPAHREARLRMAGLHVSQNNPTRAREVLEEGRERFPQQPIWAVKLAEFAQGRGQWDQAVAHWRNAVQLAATPRTLGGLGRALMQQGRPGEVETVLTSHPDMLNRAPLLQGLRGQALARAGEREKALNVFRRAMQRSRSADSLTQLAAQVRQALSIDAALAALSEVKSQLQQPNLADLAAAQLLTDAQRFDQALSRLSQLNQQLSAEAPDAMQVWLHRLRGLCYQRKGQYEQARQAYEKVLAKQPNHVNVLNNFAYMLAVNLDQPQRAVKLAKRAAGRQPSNAQVLDTLGWAQYKAGQLQAARQTLKRSIQFEPLPHNHLHLGRVLMALNSPGQARSQLNTAVQMAAKTRTQGVSQQANQWLSELSGQ